MGAASSLVVTLNRISGKRMDDRSETCGTCLCLIVQLSVLLTVIICTILFVTSYLKTFFPHFHASFVTQTSVNDTIMTLSFLCIVIDLLTEYKQTVQTVIRTVSWIMWEIMNLINRETHNAHPSSNPISPAATSREMRAEGTHLLGSCCSSGKSLSTGCSSNWCKEAFC